MPSIIVIGGPNGSGKTSLVSYLKNKKRIKTDVINPDEIALNEFGDYSFHIPAARIALAMRSSAIDQRLDLAFETTFSGNSEVNQVNQAKNEGYTAILYYVALKSVVDNLVRVDERRADNGHRVEKTDIVRRYEKSKSNLKRHIALFDLAYLFDNSGLERSRVPIFKGGKLLWLNAKHKNHPFYKALFA